MAQRFRGCSECLLQRAALQHPEVDVKGSNGPEAAMFDVYE
jgi:hypothetical protein